MRVFFILLVMSIGTAAAEESKKWLELGVGSVGEGVGFTASFKFGDHDSNWAIEYGAADEFQLFTSVVNRKDDSTVNIEVQTLGVTKNWSHMHAWGYSEVALGIGAANGKWSSNCSETVSTGFLSSTQVCDVRSGTLVGVPIHASAVIGKYAGIGISARAFLTSEDAHAGVMVIIPFGYFTR